MSAPTNWVPMPALRAVVADAFRVWKLNHPGRRLPADATADEKRRGWTDDELREYAWAFHRAPVDAVAIIAEAALLRSNGHWPKLFELRTEVEAFLKRRHTAEQHPVRQASPSTEHDATARAQMAQAQAILRGLELDGADVFRLSQLRAISAVTEAIMVRLRRQVDAGKLKSQCIEDFRNGAWPTLAQLEAIVRDIAKAGEVALHGEAAALIEQVIAESQQLEVPT